MKYKAFQGLDWTGWRLIEGRIVNPRMSRSFIDAHRAAMAIIEGMAR